MCFVEKRSDNSLSHTKSHCRYRLGHPLTHQVSAIPREVVSPQSFRPFRQETSPYQQKAIIEHQAHALKNPGGAGAGPHQHLQKSKILNQRYCNKSRPSLYPNLLGERGWG